MYLPSKHLHNDLIHVSSLREDFLFGSGLSVRVLGGKQTLTDLRHLETYYNRNNVATCYIKDPVNGGVVSGSFTDYQSLVNSVEDWGIGLFLKNATKQDYVNKCSTVEQVLDVTWDSVEPSGV